MLEQSNSLGLSDISEEMHSSSVRTDVQFSDLENELKNAVHQKIENINSEISRYDFAVCLVSRNRF